MRDANLDLFDPRTAVMDTSAYSPTSGGDPDFGFAFNDSNFSDRVLLIEVLADDLPDSHSASDGCQSLADWARYRKRPREDFRKQHDICHSFAALDITVCPEQVLDCDQPDADDLMRGENQDEEELAMIEESPSGDEAANSDDSNSDMGSSRVLRVRTLDISSPILAAKSPFFYKLFSNGMRESKKRNVTLRINASEEAALMELLNFMNSNRLTTTAAPALLDVLMAADKFEVASCMRYCGRALRNLPMTPESALLYLELPSSVLMTEAVQPLTDAAKEFLASRYKDITKFQDEVMNLPLAGIEAILASDDLQVASEDAVYDFVLKWARLHYPKIEERQEIIGYHLSRFIRFPYMTCQKLKKSLTCNDFERELAHKFVLKALLFKAEAPHRQRIIAAEDSTSSNRQYVERSYKANDQQCVVYWDLKREECGNLYPSSRIYSGASHLGGLGFFLSAHCDMDEQSSFHCFGLYLGMQHKGSVTFAVDYEFCARLKPTEKYISKYKGNYTFTGGKVVGYRNLFGVPWASFMAEDSPYFINGTLHLRARITKRQ